MKQIKKGLSKVLFGIKWLFDKLIYYIFVIPVTGIIQFFRYIFNKNISAEEKMDIKKKAFTLGVIVFIALAIIFSDFILDYTLKYPFDAIGWLFSLMDNKIGNILKESTSLFWNGTKVTIQLSLVGTAIGFIISLVLSLLITTKKDSRSSKVANFFKGVGRVLSKIYVTIIRSTPMMVQAMIIYYGLKPLLGWDATMSLIPAFSIVSINTAAYLTEVIRGGIEAIDRGQVEGARSLGLTRWQTMSSVVFPQAIKNSIPAIGNELVINIKDTSVLSVIMVIDLFKVAKDLYASTFDHVSPYIIAAVIYLILTISVSAILKQIAKKLDVKPKAIPSAN